MAEERVRASSSSSSLFTLNRPNGLENKTKTSSCTPYLHPQASLLCFKCPDAALHHSSLQTTLVPHTALHLLCPTALPVPSATLSISHWYFSPVQKDHLILASSSFSHCNTEGSLQQPLDPGLTGGTGSLPFRGATLGSRNGTNSRPRS